MERGYICYYDKRLEPCAKCGSTAVTYEGAGPVTKKFPSGTRVIIICRDCGHRTQYEHPNVELAEDEWNSEPRG